MYGAWIIISSYLLLAVYVIWCQSLWWDLVCKVMPCQWAVTPQLQRKQVTGLWATCCTAEKGVPNKTCHFSAQWEGDPLLLVGKERNILSHVFLGEWTSSVSGHGTWAGTWSRWIRISLSLCDLCAEFLGKNCLGNVLIPSRWDSMSPWNHVLGPGSRKKLQNLLFLGTKWDETTWQDWF